MVPLLIQENYIQAVRRSSVPLGKAGELVRVQKLASAADSLADSDVVRSVE